MWFRLVSAVPFLAFSAWFALFYMPISATFALALALLCLTRWRGWKTVAAWLITGTLFVVLLWVPVIEVSNAIAQVSSRKYALTLRDRLGIYGLNLVMAAGGVVVGFPEVALETTLLTLPGGRRWTFASDFPTRSAVVRRAVDSCGSGCRTEVQWRGYELASHDELRVALALNCPLVLTGRQQGDTMHYAATCEVAYPENFEIVVSNDFLGHRIALDEGIYWALQEAGWLHPYTVQYRWTGPVKSREYPGHHSGGRTSAL